MNSECHPRRLAGGCKFVSLRNLYLFYKHIPIRVGPALLKEQSSGKGLWIRYLLPWIFVLRHRSISKSHHYVSLPNVLILGRQAHLHNQNLQLSDLKWFQSVHLRTHANLHSPNPFCNSSRRWWSLSLKIQGSFRLCWGCLPSRQSEPSFLLLLR